MAAGEAETSFRASPRAIERHQNSTKRMGGNATPPRAADDFATIRVRMEELLREREVRHASEGDLRPDPLTHRGRGDRSRLSERSALGRDGSANLDQARRSIEIEPGWLGASSSRINLARQQRRPFSVGPVVASSATPDITKPPFRERQPPTRRGRWAVALKDVGAQKVAQTPLRNGLGPAARSYYTNLITDGGAAFQ
jgi:hypothetical protein